VPSVLALITGLWAKGFLSRDGKVPYNPDSVSECPMKYQALLPLTLLALTLAVPAQAENPDHVKKLLKSGRCPKCDLSGADLAAANLKKANLQGADLSNANLNLADLTRANLTEANLTGASLAFTDFTDAVLNAAQLNDAALEGGDKLGRAQSFDRATLPNGSTAYP
jgi:hypothetical protein